MRLLGVMWTRGISCVLSLRTYVPATSSASYYSQFERTADRSAAADKILAAIYFGSY